MIRGVPYDDAMIQTWGNVGSYTVTTAPSKRNIHWIGIGKTFRLCRAISPPVAYRPMEGHPLSFQSVE